MNKSLVILTIGILMIYTTIYVMMPIKYFGLVISAPFAFLALLVFGTEFISNYRKK